MSLRRLNLALIVIAMLCLAAGGEPAAAAPSARRSYLPLVGRRFPAPCTGRPLPAEPADGAILNTILPTLRYIPATPRPQFTMMTLVFATNPSFSGADAYTIGPGGRDLMPFHNLLPGRLYYWRLQESCGSKHGPWSASYRFTTGSGGVLLPGPALASPSNQASGLPSTVTFTWNPVAGALGYQFWITQVGSSSRSLDMVANPTKTMADLEPNATYDWWVLARNAYGYGSSSLTWRFRTGGFAAPPDALAGDAGRQPAFWMSTGTLAGAASRCSP
jgi:hypothetical protein